MRKEIFTIEKLRAGERLSDAELKELLLCDDEVYASLSEAAREVRDSVYGREVYVRGLIEISSYCKNDCFYCGIRRSNRNAQRYRLTKEEILTCADGAYKAGFRTFVLQGGEDAYFTDEILCDIVSSLKSEYPDAAVTLSMGERSRESYLSLRRAGADRYLLRHETAVKEHYEMLHPTDMTFDNRVSCIRELMNAGFQTGCGFMVGSPYQRIEHIVEDLKFIREIKPHMVGIGPFIPHRDTPFSAFSAGSVELTLRCLAIIRLMLHEVLLPATTALGSVNGNGRTLGVLAGANVIMPNVSPVGVREKYSLYDGKLISGAESREGILALEQEMSRIGMKLSFARGDSKISFD